MSEPQGLSPLEDAMQFIEEQDETYTEEALYDALLGAGYPSEVANEALRQRAEARSREEVRPGVPDDLKVAGADKRTDAAVALLGGAVLAWLLAWVVLWLLADEDGFDLSLIGLLILAGVLALVLLASLAVAASSKSLRRGAQGALVGFLVIPFVFFFGLAGACVVIMGGFG